MKKLFIIAVVLGALLSITACNTIRGAGEDVKAVGDGVSDAVH